MSSEQGVEEREALDGSIAKWRAIAAGTHKNGGAADCPLCQLFNPYQQHQRHMPSSESVAAGCVGCPVAARTGQSFCRGSPYEEYENSEDLPISDETMRGIAERELAFLESLR